ncbi:MAG TPA: SUMF1/EgtB/PvdO family nonheme iron enzyme, partial [Kofleriaceae bacterium]
IDQASRIVSRLDPGAVPRLVASRDRSRPNLMPPAEPRPAPAYPEPAPAQAQASRADQALPTAPDGPRARRTSKPSEPVPQVAPGGAPGVTPGGEPRRRGAVPTGPVATGSADSLGGSALDVPRAGLPGWLIGLTFVCIALFVAGLVVYLRRDAGATSPTPAPAPAPTPAPGSGSGSGRDSWGGVAPPAGVMIAVRKADGSPWFYVDPKPVTAARFRELFGGHKQDGAAGAPVVMISYNEARSYAETVGGRLLTSDEWDSAMTTPGVAPADGLREWVESPGDKKAVRARGVVEIRPDAAQNDVTFRIAMRLTGSP